ncbi:hypothetical protein Dtox_2179 [Desulfofarcimen acetoxidans DSM 771]|jgi:hypothetical protein|uniref:Uncharacterized protein n=1 Tax=Desulfofarcimen acetoxidans (strain ATCC 49208 / DSM 771 / KCTC 5769 / VKM B-1644 / 5575) TaxID=485916 RepID=C8VZM2_DESAS|nr:hypothetical protein Dtox_2179 [Desulfofarcimen acetoxidans DSM 771]
MGINEAASQAKYNEQLGKLEIQLLNYSKYLCSLRI